MRLIESVRANLPDLLGDPPDVVVVNAGSHGALARYGQDECFAVIPVTLGADGTPLVLGGDSVALVVRSACRAVSGEPFRFRDRVVPSVSLSTGIACSDGPREIDVELMCQALRQMEGNRSRGLG